MGETDWAPGLLYQHLQVIRSNPHMLAAEQHQRVDPNSISTKVTEPRPNITLCSPQGPKVSTDVNVFDIACVDAAGWLSISFLTFRV